MAEEFTLADLGKEVSQAPNTGKGAKVATGDTGKVKKSSDKDTPKYDNSNTLWVNGPKGEKYGVIQLRITLDEFNLEYPDTENAVIGFKKTERSFQTIMVYEGKSLLIGTYFPPKKWSTADIKATAGKRMFGFKPSIIEIEIGEDELI